MARSEFGKPVKRAALKRADGRCEGLLPDTGERCPCLLVAGRYHFDHVIADGLGGKPEIANCAVLCVPCHDDKTKRDVKLIARAKRREDARLGITGPKTAIRSPGFAPTAPQRRASGAVAKALPPRRNLYVQEQSR